MTVLPPAVRRALAARPRLLAIAVCFCMIAASCGSGSTAGTDTATGVGTPRAAETAASVTPESATTQTATTETATIEATAAEASATSVDTAAPTSEPTATPHPLAAASETLTPAPIGFEALAAAVEEETGPRPVAMSIDGIGVDTAPIISVGVNEDTTLEVPPADEVGWYRFGASPGEQGSAVLAAHIAFDGVDGVFRHLADVERGATVEIEFDDGSSSRWRIVSVTDYEKEALPDALWAVDGEPSLALITCGGAFNPELRSYDSNTVAIAVPA